MPEELSNRVWYWMEYPPANERWHWDQDWSWSACRPWGWAWDSAGWPSSPYWVRLPQGHFRNPSTQDPRGQ